jgi:hypothetical protein
MKKIIFYLSSLIVLFNLYSCEDFLNQTPKYSLTKDNAVIDYSSAKNIVNGIYSKITTSAIGGDIQVKLAAQAGLFNYEIYYKMGYHENSNDGSDVWQQLYAIVNAANAAIEGVSALDLSKFPSEAEKNRLIAEAREMRAFAFLQIHWLWSHWWETSENPYGLIYRDAVADLANLNQRRLTVGESYEKIIEDLEFAEKNLNDFQTSRYVSKQFAQALHAKLLLNRGWAGDYAKALELVTALKSSTTGFALETDLAKVYDESWDSKDVLFARYTGDLSSTTNVDFQYSYNLYYNPELTAVPQSWVVADPRYKVISGIARSPETWDTSTKTVFTKLYRKGRVDAPKDKYATYYFRFPEIYLLEAELNARINPSNVAAALAPLNELRGKYVNPVLPPLTATTIDEFYDVLFKEIVVSLFMENGSDWFASLRINKDGKPWVYTLKPDVNFSSNQYCWPIPYTERINHTNEIAQNPGLE